MTARGSGADHADGPADSPEHDRWDDAPNSTPGSQRSLVQLGRIVGTIGGLLGVAASLAVLFGPVPGMRLIVPSPAQSTDIGQVALAIWPVGTALVGIFGGLAAQRARRTHVLGAAVGLVFVIVLGPPAMVAVVPAAGALFMAWALFAVDRIARLRGGT